jgi:hypothetical protein
MAKRKPSVGRLRWFGAWKKSSWKVHEKREAYASGRGRYQIRRYDEGFVVRYCPPYDLSGLWQYIGTVATQEEAIALAQAQNDPKQRPGG